MIVPFSYNTYFDFFEKSIDKSKCSLVEKIDCNGKRIRRWVKNDYENYVLSKKEADEIKENREKLVLSLLKYTSSVFTNISSNIHVRFSKNSISKLSSDKAIKKSIVNGFSIKDHFEAAKNIKELFENAELFGKFKDRDNDPNIIAMYRFQIPVKLSSGKMGFAYITTKEVKIHGNRMYSIEILLNKKSLPLSKDERSRLIKSVTNGFIAIPTTKYIVT